MNDKWFTPVNKHIQAEMSDDFVLYLVSENGDIGDVLLAHSVNNYEDNFRPIKFESDLIDGEVLVKAKKISTFMTIRNQLKNDRLITCNIPGIGEIYIGIINDLTSKWKRLILANIKEGLLIDYEFLVFKYESKLT